MQCNNKAERLQKIMSAHGVSSRREAEKMINEGRVTVGGVVAEIGQTATLGVDDIAVDGVLLSPKSKPVYIMLNKPCGYVTTLNDNRGRKTVIDLLPGVDERVYPVGRLDINSEGLLLLTNDGEFANAVMHPRFGKSKTYRVRVRGDVKEAVSSLMQPMEVDSHMVRAVSVELLTYDENGGVLTIKLSQGLNRQIRKMCQLCGLYVLSLKRVAIGRLSLGKLPCGKWRYLTDAEVDALMI